MLRSREDSHNDPILPVSFSGNRARSCHRSVELPARYRVEPVNSQEEVTHESRAARLMPAGWVLGESGVLRGVLCRRERAAARRKRREKRRDDQAQGQKRAAEQQGKTDRHDASDPGRAGQAARAGEPSAAYRNHCARRSKGVASAERGGNKEPPMPPGHRSDRSLAHAACLDHSPHPRGSWRDRIALGRAAAVTKIGVAAAASAGPPVWSNRKAG